MIAEFTSSTSGVDTICLTAGLIFVFIAVIGGGFRLKDTEIPPLPAKIRGVLAVLGLGLTLPIIFSLLRETIAEMNGIPKGTIMAWKGNPQAPPRGWVICNAASHNSNPEIPDLSGKFLKGLEAGEELGAIGGSKTHRHGGVGHGGENERSGDGVAGWGSGNDRNTWGHTGEAGNMPPYYTVCYIIKL